MNNNFKMEKEEGIPCSKANIKNIFNKLDQSVPTFAFDFISDLLRAYNRNINLNEMILRSEKFASNQI